eukprot:TRINITY_DN60616_c0_g1_i1.p1 TRINITY_DN60616_c0_g1~~TRINITY_DN60616_c0_g1_i1.p1  ORF type:complete len:808 (+),score=161.56 TRINITY_DN60616_c0_g1_i1:20-2443(+)
MANSCLQLQLQEASANRQEEVRWPSDVSSLADGSNAAAEFAHAVVDALERRGYCKISVPCLGPARKDILAAARQISSFTLPHLEIEEGLLGRRSRSKVAFLGDARSSSVPDSLKDCLRRLDELSDALGALGSRLGFQAVPGCQQLLLREPVERGERRLLSPGPLSEEQVEEGMVEDYLGFLQNRKISLLYILESQRGSLELLPRSGKATKLSVQSDVIVAFRHDEMSYAYLQGGSAGPDVALQGWILQRPLQMALQGVDGDFEGLESICGGPRLLGKQMPVEEQVHIMTAAARLPAGADDIGKVVRLYRAQTDSFVEIPMVRWDVSLYYSATPEQESVPKSYTKHSGLFNDEEILGFDNTFFGIPDSEAKCMAPCWRISLEVTVEALQQRGYTRGSAQGRNMPLFFADIGNDFDPFINVSEDPKAWLAGRALGQPAVGRIAHQLGLTGNVLSVDTACSSSLVAANLMHSNMRKRADSSVEEGIVAGMMNCLNPLVYVGLSGAGMLGRTGRSMSFDNSANGYARGEAVAATVWKIAGSSDAHDVQERLGCYVSGFTNQDGRSASLTAPNGPSQQECIRSSLRMAGLAPQDVWANECHGTGTALGDPIEVGSCRAVFWRDRSQPIAITTGKSHQGHSEATAGLSGIIKTLNTLRYSTVPPQVHLNKLNAHIDDSGFPAVFAVEAWNLKVTLDGCVGGLNSFGFGGTNSRGELWACSLAAQRASAEEAMGLGLRKAAAQRIDSVVVNCVTCQRPMCFLCGLSMPTVPSGGRRHRCSDIRENASSYDSCSQCYTGSYHFRGEESYTAELES